MAARKPAAKPKRAAPATRRCRQAAYAALLAVACVGLASVAGAALEQQGLQLVESDAALAAERLAWAAHLSALGPAAAGRLIHFAAPLIGTQLSALCWSGLRPESSYALGRATLQILQAPQSSGGGSGSASAATAAAQAAPHLEDAVRGNPNLWPAHANLATVHSGLGEPLRALASLQRAIDILVIRADGAPAPAEPDRVLAALHARQGELLEGMSQELCEGGSCIAHALRAYQRAISHIGDHPLAKAGVERLSPVQIEKSMTGIS